MKVNQNYSLHLHIIAGVERLQLAVEHIRVRQRQGSEDSARAHLEARRPHVQQVRTFLPLDGVGGATFN